MGHGRCLDKFIGGEFFLKCHHEFSYTFLIIFFSILFLKYLQTMSSLILLGSGFRQAIEDTEARAAHPKRGASPPSPACRIKRTARCDPNEKISTLQNAEESTSMRWDPLMKGIVGAQCDRFNKKTQTIPPENIRWIKRIARCDPTGDSRSFKMRNKPYGDMCDLPAGRSVTGLPT